MKPRTATHETEKRHYMVVVDMPGQDADSTHTARVERSKMMTRDAREVVARWLEASGLPKTEYELAPPAAFGTFGLLATERVARSLRSAPGVQAVLEAAYPGP
jgi:hypothetical protein